MKKHTPIIYFLLVALSLLPATSRVKCQAVLNRADYDAYGVKIAINDVLAVQANNAGEPPYFRVRFAPYNIPNNTFQCFISYPDTFDHYVYSVAVAKKANETQTQFFFIGELINNNSQPFIAVANYNPINTLSHNSNSCNNTSYSVKYFNTFGHQEHYIMGIEPNGYLIYGFAEDFIFVSDTQNVSHLTVWNSSSIWPNNTFLPQAVEIADNFGIIAGFLKNDPESRVKYIAIIYLLNFNASNHQPFVVDEFRPKYTLNSWQDLLTNDDANVYSAKYDMSISINSRGGVLVGMQFINRVFLFSVNVSYPRQLINVSRNTNGRSLGNGKNVAWLGDGNMAAILVNTYSLSYQWSTSQLYIYDMISTLYSSDASPTSVFPNYHQLLPSMFNSILLNIVSSPNSLMLMDINGNLLIFNPTSPGFFPAVPKYGSIPLTTFPQQCLSGMYKNREGVHDCILCPTGTKNPGNLTTNCTACLPESFCPLGSVADIPHSMLSHLVQIVPYPKSPESTIFDEVLIQHQFNMKPGHCLVFSPLFWTLITGAIAILFIIIIGIMHFCIVNPTTTRMTKRMIWLFKKTDLIGEGELWVGGLVSFSLIVLVCFAYSFSHQYLRMYPIELMSDFQSECEDSVFNAKFQTGLHSLGIPRVTAEQEMFDLLNEQNLTLTLDFINTVIQCNVVSLQGLVGRTWSTIRWQTCNDNGSLLSLVISLQLQHMSVEVDIGTVQTIGGLRIGLSGAGREKELHLLQQLDTHESFSKDENVLAQILPIEMSITKVINATALMDSEEYNYTGIYIVTHETDPDSLFLPISQYVRATATSIVLTVTIRETPFYVKNQQLPIARQGEIIFHSLLFTIVCLEIFGLVFILYKLIIEPLYHWIYQLIPHRHNNYKSKDHKTNGSLKHVDLHSIDENVGYEPKVVSF